MSVIYSNRWLTRVPLAIAYVAVSAFWLGLVAMLDEGLAYAAAIASCVATAMLLGRVRPDGGIDAPRVRGPQ